MPLKKFNRRVKRENVLNVYVRTLPACMRKRRRHGAKPNAKRLITAVSNLLLDSTLQFDNIMSSLNHRSVKRRRRKPPTMHYNVSSAEERFLHQALQNSKLDFRRVDGKLDIPSAPTFFPTVEEFEAGPMAYIEKIRHQAQKYGICKVVPPSGWNPEFCK